jgi:hypothetical protein
MVMKYRHDGNSVFAISLVGCSGPLVPGAAEELAARANKTGSQPDLNNVQNLIAY